MIFSIVVIIFQIKDCITSRLIFYQVSWRLGYGVCLYNLTLLLPKGQPGGGVLKDHFGANPSVVLLVAYASTELATSTTKVELLKDQV